MTRRVVNHWNRHEGIADHDIFPNRARNGVLDACQKLEWGTGVIDVDAVAVSGRADIVNEALRRLDCVGIATSDRVGGSVGVTSMLTCAVAPHEMGC